MRHSEQSISQDRLGFALQRERPDRLDARITLCREADRLAQQDRPRLGQLLESRGNIRCVADYCAVHRQAFAERPKNDGPGMDADPHRQVQPAAIGGFIVAAERALDRSGRQQRTPDMVLVSNRRAKQGQKPVAGKLRRGAAVAMHLGKARLQKRSDEIAHRLGPEAFGERCGADDVAAQNRHLPHLAGTDISRHPNRGGAGFISRHRSGIA